MAVVGWIGIIFVSVVFCSIFSLSLSADSEPERHRCYQCTDSVSGGDCQDSARLLNITDNDYLERKGTEEDAGVWRRNTYYKECAENETYCMIETYQSGGKYLSYHRDCSDGVTFSHSGSKTVVLPRLDDLEPNNQTTCTYMSSLKTHICIRLCFGDMCNGPVEVFDACRNQENVTVTDEFGKNHTCSVSAMTPAYQQYDITLLYLTLVPIVLLLKSN